MYSSFSQQCFLPLLSSHTSLLPSPRHTTPHHTTPHHTTPHHTTPHHTQPQAYQCNATEAVKKNGINDRWKIEVSHITHTSHTSVKIIYSTSSILSSSDSTD